MSFGLSVALATPFENDGQIATDLMVAHARRCLDAGCDSATLFGTTGEGASVGGSERGSILTAFANAGIPAEKLVVGVLVDSVADAARQAEDALARGVRNVLLAPPSYFKNVSDDGLFDWFSAVIGELGETARDIIVYNIPSVTMVPLSSDLIGRLKQAFPRIVTGVKDSSGDWAYTQTLLDNHRDLIILIGDERHLAQGVRLGGQGAISGMANFAPAEVRAMAVDGRDDERIVAFVAELLEYPVTPAVKAMLSHVSGNEAWLTVRPPLRAVSRDDMRKMANAFEALFSSKAA